jgi:hypothetical protein
MVVVLASLDEAARLDQAFDDWSIKQMVAHIAGWQRLNTEMMKRMATGEHPVPDGADYGDDDAMNASFAAAADGATPAVVTADYITAYNEFLRAAEALPEERFADGRFAAQVLQGNGIDHVREHLAEIRAFVADRAR